MHRSSFTLLLFSLVFELCGQSHFQEESFFQKRDFGHYFYSDRYAPMTNIGIGPTLLLDNYDIGSERKDIVLLAEPSLGAQLPIYSFKNAKARFAVSIPLAFSVWFDFTEERTSPILNTDYTVALPEFNYSRVLPKSKINNIGFRFIPVFHESTHIGDEFIISKLQDSIPFFRVNVSYQTFELTTMIKDPYNEKIKNHCIKAGAKFLWNRTKGYYTVDSNEMNTPVHIDPSSRWIEPYLQYQYQNPNARLSNDGMMFIFSLDFHLRVRYGYGSYSRNDKGEIINDNPGESYQLCTTGMAGWRFYKKDMSLSNTSLFLKGYWGLNPHGQFRNIPTYPWLGINWIYDI